MKTIPSRTGPPNGRILVVDDDPFVRSAIADSLERHGYAVLQAEDAGQGIAMARTNPIDAFLLDVEMPGTSGIELCRMLRAMAPYKAAPILFFTGADEQDWLGQAFAAGADDFIGKPVETFVLLARLKGHLERHTYFQQLERARQMLNRYVSRRTREVAEEASRTGKLLPPEQRDVVILFSDIRGFTALADEMDMEREKLFALLSEQLALQVDMVYDHGGYIDKFGGDGVMAVFDGGGRALQACLCALRIMDSARGGDGGESARIHHLGIGVHGGRAIIGNIGSQEHLDYSVIGTTVNLAARLCGQAEAMSVVVSEAVHDAAVHDPRLHFHSERRVAIRGLKEPVRVYTLSRGGNSVSDVSGAAGV